MDSLLLSVQHFNEVIERSPLISLDFVVRNTQDKVLLGLRSNAPAKGYWFVPGGRILKAEPISMAFKRLMKQELNLSSSAASVRKLGLYEHFYEDSCFDSTIHTHYVVNAYELQLNEEQLDLPLSQHTLYRWFDIDELLADNSVHKHTKWYFQLNTFADSSFL